MRVTIGRKWPTNKPNGDYCVYCDYCGVKWRRSQCTRDRAGRLACPDDRAGRDEVTLSELNASGAARQRRTTRTEAGGFYSTLGVLTGDDDPNFLTQRTTRDDI